MEWNYIVLIISAILVMLLVLMELRRKKRRNLTWRLLASVLAVAAITCIALPPHYNKNTDTAGAKELVLLTEDYSKDSLARFKSAVIIATDKSLLDRSGAKKKILIPSIDYYLAANPDVKSINIIGAGLPEDELAMLKDIRVRFHQPAPAFGFQNVNWQDVIKSGDELVISGTFNNNSDKPVGIQLKGMGTTLDSATVSRDSLIKFQLTCTPRQLGRALNHLVVTSGEDTLGIEKIPFEVEPVKPLNIFILSSAPGFEVNFLKQWFRENKFGVAIRSKISKDKFSTEFVNMTPAPLNLRSRMLDGYDVLIADETSINKLSQAERNAINSQVSGGMGLLILNEDEVQLAGSFGTFSTLKAAAEQGYISVRIPGIQFQTQLPVGEINYLASQNDDQPLVRDNKNRILVNSRSAGRGRLIFSTINNTYFMRLSGNRSDYSSFWAYLIGKAARKEQAKGAVKIPARFPVVGEKTKLMIRTSSNKVPKVYAAETPISLEQDMNLPERWTGVFWPLRSGWNTLRTDGLSSRFFVFGTADWVSARNRQYSEATRQFAERSKSVEGKNSEDTRLSREPIPPVFFYLLLLVCCSYLWIETRFL